MYSSSNMGCGELFREVLVEMVRAWDSESHVVICVIRWRSGRSAEGEMTEMACDRDGL